MSRKGTFWDNAPMESLFGKLKNELFHQGEYLDRDAARRDLFAYIEGYYNRQRLHSAIERNPVSTFPRGGHSCHEYVGLDR